jgi:hypothetical protein
MARRFHPLMAITAIVRSTSSLSLNALRAISYVLSGTCSWLCLRLLDGGFFGRGLFGWRLSRWLFDGRFQVRRFSSGRLLASRIFLWRPFYGRFFYRRLFRLHQNCDHSAWREVTAVKPGDIISVNLIRKTSRVFSCILDRLPCTIGGGEPRWESVKCAETSTTRASRCG